MSYCKAYLIHNKDPKRQKNRKTIKEFLKTFSIDTSSIYKQNDLKDVKNKIILKSKIISNKLNYSLSEYHYQKLISQKSKLFLLLNRYLNIIKIIIKYSFTSKKVDKTILKHIFIEQSVTSKHIKAWEAFVSSQKQIIIVFEDDIECNKNSHKEFSSLLDNLNQLMVDYPNLYIDLAGGFEAEKVLPIHKSRPIKPFDHFFKGIYTNTACGYLVNKDLIKTWLKMIDLNENLKKLPIDHMINALGNNCKNFAYSGHKKYPIFIHGSFVGNVKSWQS